MFSKTHRAKSSTSSSTCESTVCDSDNPSNPNAINDVNDADFNISIWDRQTRPVNKFKKLHHHKLKVEKNPTENVEQLSTSVQSKAKTLHLSTFLGTNRVPYASSPSLTGVEFESNTKENWDTLTELELDKPPDNKRCVSSMEVNI